MADHSQLRWWSSPRALLRHILMLDDTAHSVALGTAVGMFIGMTPTVGIQMLLVIGFAILVGPFLRFNRVAALVTVYISNPLTILPIYWFDYCVGTFFVAGDVSWVTFTEMLGTESKLSWYEQFHWLFVEVGAPLIVGSLVVATLLALATYPAMRGLLRTFHRKKKSEKKSESQKEPLATTTK